MTKENLKQTTEFIQEAKKATPELIKKKEKAKKAPKTVASVEFKKLFVKAAKARKKTKQTDIETSFDDYALSTHGEYKLTSKAYENRLAFFRLKESLDTGKMLTGTVGTIEKIGEHYTAVIFLGDFKVVIPAFEFTNISGNIKPSNVKDAAEYALTLRLGSTVDFIKVAKNTRDFSHEMN